METKIKELIEKYRDDSKQVVIDSNFLIDKIKGDKRLETYICNSAVIAMCIKYESFTSEAYGLIFGGEISFNKPWQYTREIYKYYSIQNWSEYDEAKNVWQYYNSLKHANEITKHKIQTLASKYQYISYSSDRIMDYVSKTIDNIFVRIEKNLHKKV